jgi:hypothetical protein
MDFLYAAELKKRFVCYGHFYELALISGERVRCRSVLEIVDTGLPSDDPSVFSEQVPDAVVIMMNPGSSHPKDGGHVDEVIEYPADPPENRKALVLTQPDNTQYQVMRVGVRQGWQHIRVLNLSDMRDPKSGSFLQKVDALCGVMGGHVHSMFCPERRDELKHSLRRKTPTPILLGWGQDMGLLPLVEQCMAAIAGEPTCTVRSDVHPALNAHPSPMLQKKKLEWLSTILGQLKE